MLNRNLNRKTDLKPPLSSWVTLTGGSIFCATTIAALLSFGALASAAEFYVAPSGSDSNAGTLTAPFQTIAKARDAVKAISPGMTSDTLIYLRGGTYVLTASIALDASDSGANGHDITYLGYPGEDAVISGGKPITGWSLYDSTKNIYRANVGTGWDFRQLYVNGTHVQRARGPSNPSGFTRTSTGFTTTDTSMATWKNLPNVEVVLLGNWMMDRCKVASISGDSITVQNPSWSNAQWSMQWGTNLPAWIENAYELLDTPGEWYLDTTGGYVYYIPRADENMTPAEVIAPNLADLISGTNVSNIQFKNLSFMHSNWTDPDNSGNGYVGLQAGYHFVGVNADLIRMHSPIYFSASHNIVFQHDLFAHLGSRALTFDQGSQNIQVLANKFIDNAGGAVQFGQIDDSANKNPATQNTGITIQDNYIGSGTSFDYPDDAEIVGGYVANMLVSHNEIAGSPWNAISIGWGWGADSYSNLNQVTWNYIHQFSQSFPDSGAIYTLSAQPNMAINNNYMIDGGLGYGCVYPDEGSAYESWTSNVCRQVPDTWLHIWTTSIHDNTVTGNWVDTANILNNGTDNTVSNNRVITNGIWPRGAQRVMNRAGISSGVTPGPTGRSRPAGESATQPAGHGN